MAAFLSAIFLFALGFFWTSRQIKYDFFAIIMVFLKVLLASILMAFCVYILQDMINIFLLVPLGVIVYLILLFLFRGLQLKEIKDFYHSLATK